MAIEFVRIDDRLIHGQVATTWVKKYDIEPSNLKIEITETTIMSDVPNLMGELEELRKAGFTLEMDDFGSGYSSLNTLKDMDVDVLKIDMGFLRTTKSDRIQRSMSILNNIIDLYTYGYTNDGVLGWTPGYVSYEIY